MVESVTALKSVLDNMNGLPGQTGTVSTQKLGTKSNGIGASADVPEVTFSNQLAALGMQSINTLKQGEAAAISGLQGTMTTQKVVEAVMASELTLHTALAVRNKAVAAYQEISRMQI